MDTRRGTLVIACGALAREIAALRRANGWTRSTCSCLPAELHNRPERIARAVRAEIRAAPRAATRTIFVAYGDCGTGGMLDALLREEGVERLPGAHCYEFFAGARSYSRRSRTRSPAPSTSPTSCCATSTAWSSGASGLDRHPELATSTSATTASWSIWRRTRSAAAASSARAEIAARLGLEFEYRITGYGELGTRLRALAASEDVHAWPA